MKSAWKQYFVFTRAERTGSMLILSVLAIAVLIALLLPCYRYPVVGLEEQKLAAVWEQRHQAARRIMDQPSAAEPAAALFYFDPNTLDSMGFIRLGLAAKTTHFLLNWRNKGKQFYHKEEFKALYTLREEEYNRLAPFITIRQKPEQAYGPHRYTAYDQLPPLPDLLDLNRADSATLVRMKGIGPFIAHKLLERRQALGGFTATVQLLEAFRFPDSTYQYLSAHFKISSDAVRRLNINTATEEQLARHPYIGEKMAKNIILLRNGLIKFEKTAQLRQVPLMNEEKYRKIAPYCTID